MALDQREEEGTSRMWIQLIQVQSRFIQFTTQIDSDSDPGSIHFETFNLFNLGSMQVSNRGWNLRFNLVSILLLVLREAHLFLKLLQIMK